MALLAEADVSTPVVVTVVGMVITSLGAFGAAFLSYLSNRDKLRFDSRTALMEQNLSNMLKANLECEADRDDLKERASKLEDARDRHEKEVVYLRREVAALREQLDSKADGT